MTLHPALIVFLVPFGEAGEGGWSDDAVRCTGHRSVLHQVSQRGAQAHAAHCVFRRFPSAVFCEFVFPVCLPCMPASIKVLPGLAGKLHLRLAFRSVWHSGQIPLIMRLMA